MTEPRHPADQRLDERLAADGARWRAAQPAPAELDPARLTAPRRPRWQPLAAAASVLALTAAITAAVALGRDPAPPPAAAPFDAGLAPPDAVVGDGDRVRAVGQVLALPGRPVRLCAPVARAGPARPGPEPVPAYCELGVTLLGADLDRLGSRQERDGAVWGLAEVMGTYRDRTVTVTAQRPSAGAPASPRPPKSFPVDCAAPPGGWPRGEVQSLPGIERATRYVTANPTVLGSISIAYPYPVDAGRIGTQVLLVTTTGDVEQARAAVRQWYTGSLCVRKVPHSRAQMLRARTVLQKVLHDRAAAVRYGFVSGTGEFSDSGGDPRTSMDVVVYDALVHGLRRSAGVDLVVVDPPLLRRLG